MPTKKTAKQEKLQAPNHFLIPKHSKLRDKEKKELLKKYNINENNLPRILSKDSAIAHLSLEAGDVVKIIRKSPTAGETVFYRVVI